MERKEDPREEMKKCYEELKNSPVIKHEYYLGTLSTLCDAATTIIGYVSESADDLLRRHKEGTLDMKVHHCVLELMIKELSQAMEVFNAVTSQLEGRMFSTLSDFFYHYKEALENQQK